MIKRPGLLCALLLSSLPAGAAEDMPMKDDVSLPAYLGLLEQLSPLLRQSAELYLQAHQQRCTMALPVLDLRHAFTHGEPVLMKVVQHLGRQERTQAIAAASRVPCKRG